MYNIPSTPRVLPATTRNVFTHSRPPFIQMPNECKDIFGVCRSCGFFTPTTTTTVTVVVFPCGFVVGGDGSWALAQHTIPMYYSHWLAEGGHCMWVRRNCTAKISLRPRIHPRQNVLIRELIFSARQPSRMMNRGGLVLCRQVYPSL